MSDDDDTPATPIRSWAVPPPGWYPTGTHHVVDSEIEFSQATDEDGLPLWERPVQDPEQSSPDPLDAYFDELSEDPEILGAYLEHRESAPDGTEPNGPDTIWEARGDK